QHLLSGLGGDSDNSLLSQALSKKEGSQAPQSVSRQFGFSTIGIKDTHAEIGAASGILLRIDLQSICTDPIVPIADSLREAGYILLPDCVGTDYQEIVSQAFEF